MRNANTPTLFNLVFSGLALASGGMAQQTAQGGKDTGAEIRPIYLAATETEALLAKDGQRVTVHGVTDGSGKSDSGTNFVNFKEADFYLVTFKSDLGAFEEGEPADLFEGKRIAVTGVVSIYQGKPQFKLTNPAQVRVLEADAEFPPEAPDAAQAPETGTEKARRPAKGEPVKPAKRKPPVDPKRFFK